MTTYTVDCRGIFNIHERGCAHVRDVQPNQQFDFDSNGTTKDDIRRDARRSFNGDDPKEPQSFRFAPCVSIPGTMAVLFPVKIQVDLAVYAQAYGYTIEEARADAKGHLREAANEAIKNILDRMAVGATLVD